MAKWKTALSEVKLSKDTVAFHWARNMTHILFSKKDLRFCQYLENLIYIN